MSRMWWGCYLEEISMNAAGFFFFKFKSQVGMEKVMESGSWMVIWVEDGLMEVVAVKYPQREGDQSRGVKIEVGYQRKPLCCNHCKIFEHGTESQGNDWIIGLYKSRLGTEEDVAANLLKDDLKRSNAAGVGIVDGFQVVGRWNRVVSNQVVRG
ncbi:hypothetical protein L6452_17323 [Arctium lappa]|uniref:Uncharacterized protein n=1 Tax=Arctium lappa TaxID=4217 RepID=A0ACB9C3E0_ARCLA|nr:hypothetical protein L6452_17323 [Arctium lappa]